MNPLRKLPSLGTISAGPARIWVLLLMLTNAAVILAAVLLLPYLVIIRSAWSKSAGRAWRAFVIASVAAAASLALACSPLFIPTGTPVRLTTPDAFGIAPDPLSSLLVIILNAALVAGLALAPLSVGVGVGEEGGVEEGGGGLLDEGVEGLVVLGETVGLSSRVPVMWNEGTLIEA